MNYEPDPDWAAAERVARALDGVVIAHDEPDRGTPGRLYGPAHSK